jgi:hypothetical protein
VNSGILPSLAILYRPLGSRASATSSGKSTKTSTKAKGESEPVVTACSSRACLRSALKGEMKDVMAIVDESAKSFATCKGICQLANSLAGVFCAKCRTSAILRMFSFRSFSLNPRSLFSPNRTLSPSRRYAANPRWRRCCSSAVAMVDLPDADSPVNQMVKPFCLRYVLRSSRESDGCHVMLLFRLSVRVFCVAR